MTICSWERCLLYGFYGCLYLPLQKQERPIALKFLYQDRTKNGSITMIRRHYDSPPPERACVQTVADKIMLTVFWDQRRVVMMGFLAKDTTITSLLKELRKSIKTERRGMLTRGV